MLFKLCFRQFILSVLGIIISFNYIHGQSNSIYLMHDVWQKNNVNPSFHTFFGNNEDDKWNLSFLTYAQSIGHSGPSLESLYKIDDNRNLIVTPQNWVNKLDENQLLNTKLNIQTFNISRKLNSWIFSLGHSVHADFGFSYSKNLMSLIAEGNAKYIEKSIDLPHSLYGDVYSKFGLGVLKSFNKLDLGVRINLLNGFQHLSTPKTDVSLLTEDEIYQLRFQMDYEIRSAGKFDLKNLEGSSFIASPGIFNSLTSNRGYSLDLGINWRPNNKLSIEAAVLNIGQIKWTENTNNYKLEGEYKFGGIDIFNNGIDTFDFNEIKDSLIDAFDLNPNSMDDFTTKLPILLSVQASYKITDKLLIQALYLRQSLVGDYHTMSLGLNYNITDGINIGTSYSNGTGKTQLGFNASLRWKYIQIFGATDNVLGLYNIKYSLNSGGIIGMNIYI